MFVSQWRFDTVDRDGAPISTLTDVTGGTLSGNANQQVRWSGSITVGAHDTQDWNQIRIRPVLTVIRMDRKTGTRTVSEYPYGVYLPRVNDVTVTSTGERTKLDLFDRTLVASEDAVTSTFSLPAGTTVTSAVRDILASTGELGVSVTATSDVLRSDMTWEPGTSKLKIINELADTAGYFALWCDFNGQYRFEPYKAPSARPIVYEFRPSQEAVHISDMAWSRDTTVHNQVVCVSQETSDQPAWVAVARNEDPTSPWSFQAQGRWVTRVETGVEATSQSVLNEYAQRLLVQEGDGGAVFERRMIPRPIGLNSVVADADGGREVVEEVSVTCTAGALMSVTSRQVVS